MISPDVPRVDWRARVARAREALDEDIKGLHEANPRAAVRVHEFAYSAPTTVGGPSRVMAVVDIEVAPGVVDAPAIRVCQRYAVLKGASHISTVGFRVEARGGSQLVGTSPRSLRAAVAVLGQERPC